MSGKLFKRDYGAPPCLLMKSDVKVINATLLSGPVTIAIEEDFQQWRLLCLALGFMFLLLAPVVSSSVPFYYSSSMAIGIFLVVLIILFQVVIMPISKKDDERAVCTIPFPCASVE